MSNHGSMSREDYIYFVTSERAIREDLELKLRESRDRSRFHTLEAITKGGLSVAKASQLSGHHRATITVWLQVLNAERKNPHEKK